MKKEMNIMKKTVTKILCIMAFVSVTIAGTYSGGDGSAGFSYKITTAADLVELSDTPADWATGVYFSMLNDIDLSGVTEQIHIGTAWGNEFNGNFDGAYYEIMNYSWLGSRETFTGLFGVVGSTGWVKRVTLSDVDINPAATIGIDGGMVASLVAENFGTVIGCEVISGTVTAGEVGVCYGGVVGQNNVGAKVENCKFAANLVSTVYGMYAGGVVGQNSGDVIFCKLAPEATININDVAYLAYQNDFTYTLVGGIVGFNMTGGQISLCEATDGVNAIELKVFDGIVGGIVGFNSGMVYRSDSFRDVRALEVNISTGSIAGRCLNGSVLACIGSSYVEGQVFCDIGGLVGRNGIGSVLEESYFDGTMWAGIANIAGGLVGQNDGDVLNSYAEADLAIWSRASNVNAGGVVGVNTGTVTDAYSACVVDSGSQDSAVGGVNGWNDGGSLMSAAYDNEITPQLDVVKIDRNPAGTATSFGANTATMMTLSTFVNAGWDIDDTGDMVWIYIPGMYPKLSWTLEKYSGGYGTMAKPYLLSVPADIQEIAETPTDWVPDTYFEFTNDISLEGYTFGPIGLYYVQTFQGQIDGKGFEILGFAPKTSGLDEVGFGFISNLGNQGVLQNLGITAYFSQDFAQATGLLVGVNAGTIYRCWSAGSLYVPRDYSYAGGIAGSSSVWWYDDQTDQWFSTGPAMIEQCFSLVSFWGGGVDTYFGGIAGHTYGGTVEQCYYGSGGMYTDPNTASGALVGNFNGAILASFHQSDTATPGFPTVGLLSYGSIVDSGPKTFAEMADEQTYIDAGWYINEWGLTENEWISDWALLYPGGWFPELTVFVNNN